jgi:selenocysteine lyase/cysteine desulfurase
MPHEEYVGIRITPSIYTTVSEIDYFSETMERELKEA